MTDETDEPLLLTPGPLTTSDAVKAAMGRDWGSRDTGFIEMTARVRAKLLALAGGAEATHACVPIQGSGTFAVEAALQTVIPGDGKVLVLVNGAYGTRMAEICRRIGRACATYETEEDRPPDSQVVAEMLVSDPAITHLAVVQCETTSGILNPLDEIARVTAAAGRHLIVDAMSAFGALPLDLSALGAQAVAASANKCLQGVPGLGLVFLEKSVLEGPAHATTLSLDLADQWRAMEKTGQWRFTPPTHVLAALDQALAELEAEGGIPARLARYKENCRILVDGLRALGLETFLSDNLQAPIIVTFHTPADAKFEFERFYDLLKARGYAIYPGKLTRRESFRIGCIGDLEPEDMTGAVAAVGEALAEMGVAQLGRKIR